MKTINLFVDFEFTSLSPDAQPVSIGVVSEDMTKYRPNEIISESHKLTYNYLLRNPITKKVFYVGNGTARRCLIHEWAAKRGNNLKNARKYNEILSILKEGLHTEVIIVACGITKDIADNNEYLLTKYFGLDHLTNMFHGGKINPMSNLDTREYIRQYHIGRKRSVETRKKQSDLKINRKLSKEHCVNISKSLADNCYAGKRIKITNMIDNSEYFFNSMLKAEKEIPLTHESMSRKLKLGNGVAFIKHFKLEYYEA